MKTRRPGIVGALFVAAMLTAALIGIFFFAWRTAGLPFVPFDAFDWEARVLLGRIIAFGIGSMVTVIQALNLGPTATTAKTAEQGMAIAGTFIAGVLGGFIVFLILRTAERVRGFAVGLALGVVLGVPAVLIRLAQKCDDWRRALGGRRMGTGGVSHLGRSSRPGRATADRYRGDNRCGC